jgi:DeoR family transcriptional regulator, aga operon transcriptional repressor
VNAPIGKTLAASERRHQILALVRASGYRGIADLAARFGVSKVTIRGDLDGLAKRGYLVRVRGGAIPSSDSTKRAFEARQSVSAEEKITIAEAAVGLLSSGDSIILDVGTTTMAIARALVSHTDLENISVFTSGLNIALALESATPRIEVMVTGGSLRPLEHSLVEPHALTLLQEIRVSYAFIGCDGVHPVRGITVSNFPEARVKQAMLQASHQRVVVADSTKLLREGLVKICNLDDVDVVLTAGDMSPDVRAAFRDAPADLDVVPMPYRNPGSPSAGLETLADGRPLTQARGSWGSIC